MRPLAGRPLAPGPRTLCHRDDHAVAISVHVATLDVLHRFKGRNCAR
jgi:hypothetical protein